jgi:hypothetical protein
MKMAAEFIWTAAQLGFQLLMFSFPDRHRPSEDISSLSRKQQTARSAVACIDPDFEKPTAFERFEHSGDRCSIHRE